MLREFQVVDVEQRTPDWFRARLGLATGSHAKEIVARIKTGEAAKTRDYRAQLVTERLTSELQEDVYVTDAMQHGLDTQAAACAAYEALSGQLVEESGFLRHTRYMAGCSLDGYVGDYDGIVEFKCPTSPTHLRWLRAGVVPPEHLPQVMHNLWICGTARWANGVSFDNRFPPDLALFVVRVERDERALLAYEQKLLAFLDEVDKDCAEVQALWTRRRQMATSISDVLREVLALHA